jgi:hypothetical protein
VMFRNPAVRFEAVRVADTESITSFVKYSPAKGRTLWITVTATLANVKTPAALPHKAKRPS